MASSFHVQTPSEGAMAFQTPSEGAMAFQTPSEGAMAFQTPSEGAMAFQTPSEGAMAFQTPSEGAMAFQTPSEGAMAYVLNLTFVFLVSQSLYPFLLPAPSPLPPPPPTPSATERKGGIKKGRRCDSSVGVLLLALDASDTRDSLTPVLEFPFCVLIFARPPVG